MTRVAVVAHRRKTLGAGLLALKEHLASQGVDDPLWYEVPKSKKAPKAAKKAVADGADLVFVWGGDGTVQRCLGALAGSSAAMAVLPAGTANHLARNLDVPLDMEGAVAVGLAGARRRLDLGRINGEHFAVMGGTGLDATLIAGADRDMKRRHGRLAYVWTGLRAVRDTSVDVHVKVDGATFYEGPAGCVLFANVGTITGGIEAFPDAEPDDGHLDVGVVTAAGPLGWGRVLARSVAGRADRSPLVRAARGRTFDVRLSEPRPWEVDGGDRPPTDRLRVETLPGALEVCVPAATS